MEVLYACDEALRIIGRHGEPDEPAVALEPGAPLPAPVRMAIDTLAAPLTAEIGA